MTSTMVHKALSRYALSVVCLCVLGCAQHRDGGSMTDTPSGTAGERNRMLAGSWKLAGVDCQGPGKNCRRYPGSRVFRFDRNGELFVDGTRRGTYRLAKDSCVIDAGDRSYHISILELDSSRLITGESFRRTTEIFQKSD